MAAKKTDKPADKGAAKPKADKAPKAEAKPAAPVAAPAPAPVAAPPAPAAAAPQAKAHGFKRTLVGRVTSDKMNKTVTVEVTRNAPDPMYKKYVRMRDRYKAHDETNQYKTGDRVEITEHRPISRDKRWIVTKLIARPVQE